MSKTLPHSLASAPHQDGRSHVRDPVFSKTSKEGLSTCFWGLFTVHRFVSSRVNSSSSIKNRLS